MARDIENQPLNDVFKSHPICEVQHQMWKAQIIDAFSDYVCEDTFDKWHLSLYRFATIRPLTYIRREAIDETLGLFEQYPDLTIDGVTTLQRELSHAIFSMLRPGVSWTKEEKLSLDRPEQMAEFDSTWHPEYQRYCEHVFNHLIQLPLHVIGARRGKNYPAQPLANRAKLLQKNGLASLIAGYDPVVRNAISHGSTSFEITGVNYVDRKDSRLLATWEFADLFDSLIDTCHSILVALLIFFCENRTDVEVTGLEKLPLGLRFMFTDAFSSHPGFELLSMLESNTTGPKKQLNVVCRISSKARWAQLFEGMHTCWQASTFGGEIYNRFFVAFDCGMPVLSSLAVDGDSLQNAIRANETLSECSSGIIETSLLWYDAPKLERKLYTWRSWLPIGWQITKREIIKLARQRSEGTFISLYCP